MVIKNKINILYTFLILWMMAWPMVLDAKHIVGGDVTYDCLSISGSKVKFLITFTMYRDVYGNGALFDDPARFGIWRGSGDNWEYTGEIQANVGSVKDVDIDTGNPCLQVPPGIGVEKGVYQFKVELEISDEDSYIIGYQRCCRNNTIFNILDPNITGAVYLVEITPEAQRMCDDSPKWNGFPPIVICANEPLAFDHSATDPDGDQVVYTFCAPLASGGTDGVNGVGDPNGCNGITPSPVTCRPPFDEVKFRTPAYRVDRPLGAGVTLNQSTGLISGTPQVNGQFVVGICAKSYRNGEYLGEIRRDFQFNVTSCEVAVHAAVEADDVIEDVGYVINSCGELEVTFNNQSQLESKIVSYDWEIYQGNDTIHYSTRDVTHMFPDTGTYTGMLFLNSELQFDGCKDTAKILVNIFPDISADFDYQYDTCVAGPVDFKDLSVSGAGPITGWEWTFEDGQMSSAPNPKYKYPEPGEKIVSLQVSDKNNCSAIVQKKFSYLPVPEIIVVQPSQYVGCTPGTITFTNLSSPINDSYDIQWDFGDGSTSDEINPSHIYDEPGVFDIGLKIVSPIGCSIQKDFSGLIRIKEGPIAGFDFSPKQPSIFNKTVSFLDDSQDAVGWIWDIDGVGYLEQNPTHTFRDTGLVNVEQIVVHENGCTDTASAVIDVMPLVTLHMPNAFTPNHDGLNDIFIGTGFLDGLRDFSMQIWNRWGEMIFSSTDPYNGWNGTKDGVDSPPGVYVFSVKYLGPRGKMNNLKGHVTLIR